MTRTEQQIYTTESLLGTISYDLLGELVSGAKVTRSTAAKILTAISKEKFELYKHNPEDFIQKVCRIIREQKATTLINNITYRKTDHAYDDEVFTINNLTGSLQKNILEVKKHIYSYVKTDSDIERAFAEQLESGAVSVYAKLPRGFKIPTPVGNYNPDWAIVFDSDTVKHIYFIAETKGSMSTMDLKKSEELKIAYARKHFEALSDVNLHYDVVSTYEDLMQKVM